MNCCGECDLYDRGHCHINPPHILFNGDTYFSVQPQVGAADVACTHFRRNAHGDVDAVMASLKSVSTGE